MLEITPHPIAKVRAFLGDAPAGLSISGGADELPGDAPFIQLAYDELDGAEIDDLLGYAGIPQANAPIGVHGNFAPYAPQAGWLVFPFSGLIEHLRQCAPDLTEQYDRAGSFENYAQSNGDEISAREYLILGTLEMIAYCARHHLALTIRW